MEIAEGFKDVKGAELECGVVELGGVEIGGESGRRLLPGAGVVEPGLFQDPILVAAVFPTGEVHDIEPFALLAQVFDDVGVAEAILDHGINFMAEGFG